MKLWSYFGLNIDCFHKKALLGRQQNEKENINSNICVIDVVIHCIMRRDYTNK